MSASPATDTEKLWPWRDRHQPPERVYLGVDESSGHLTVTWWTEYVSLQRYPDDLVYVRKDLMDERIASLTAVIKRLGGET